MPLLYTANDITRMHTDAIVNAANNHLAMGGGVCGAIFHKAGVEKMEKACRRLAPVPTGHAVITPGFDLPANFVIHAVGPTYSMYSPAVSRQLLASAYTSALEQAYKAGLSSVSFPLISAGIYGYPKKEAFQVAVEAIETFLKTHDLQVYLVFFDRQDIPSGRRLDYELRRQIEQARFLEAHPETFAFEDEMIDAEDRDQEDRSTEAVAAFSSIIPPKKAAPEERCCGTSVLSSPSMAMPESLPVSPAAQVSGDLSSMLRHLDVPFHTALLAIIDRKGMSDAEVYRKANLDRRLFSKIRSGKDGYTPRKPTILALCVALGLSLQETEDLLALAGYAFSPARIFDVIVRYYIASGRCNIFEINEVLFEYDQTLLGG